MFIPDLALRRLRLDLHQRFILHIHFVLTLAAARSVPLRRGCGELRNGAQFDRIGFDLNQVVSRCLRCGCRCRNHGQRRCCNRDLGWCHYRRQGRFYYRWQASGEYRRHRDVFAGFDESIRVGDIFRRPGVDWRGADRRGFHLFEGALRADGFSSRCQCCGVFAMLAFLAATAASAAASAFARGAASACSTAAVATWLSSAGFTSAGRCGRGGLGWRGSCGLASGCAGLPRASLRSRPAPSGRSPRSPRPPRSRRLPPPSGRSPRSGRGALRGLLAAGLALGCSSSPMI